MVGDDIFQNREGQCVEVPFLASQNGWVRFGFQSHCSTLEWNFIKACRPWFWTCNFLKIKKLIFWWLFWRWVGTLWKVTATIFTWRWTFFESVPTKKWTYIFSKYIIFLDMFSVYFWRDFSGFAIWEPLNLVGVKLKSVTVGHLFFNSFFVKHIKKCLTLIQCIFNVIINYINYIVLTWASMEDIFKICRSLAGSSLLRGD